MYLHLCVGRGGDLRLFFSFLDCFFLKYLRRIIFVYFLKICFFAFFFFKYFFFPEQQMNLSFVDSSLTRPNSFFKLNNFNRAHFLCIHKHSNTCAHTYPYNLYLSLLLSHIYYIKKNCMKLWNNELIFVFLVLRTINVFKL